MALLAATVMPAMVPSLVAAATVTDRSIALSSSSKSASDVTYELKFTPVAAADAFVIDFCNDTPIVGETCTPPTGMVTTSATSATSGFTDVDDVANGGNHNTLRVVSTSTMAAGTPVTVTIDHITNPSTTDPLYARIVTYDGGSSAATASADAYTSTAPGTYKDDGGVAISITDTVGVSGAVLESMTFCAANQTITKDCGDADSVGHEPVLKLGESVGGTVALVPGTTSTGSIYTQISTNAATGAVVWLKSGVDCGGMKRLGAATCDILPSTDGIGANDAEFGVKTAATATDSADANASGTYQATNGYNSSTYLLKWVSGNATGVSSTYGDQILNTDSKPVNNKNMQLTFGAQVNNTTPAGLYSADLSLIATGKF